MSQNLHYPTPHLDVGSQDDGSAYRAATYTDGALVGMAVAIAPIAAIEATIEEIIICKLLHVTFSS